MLLLALSAPLEGAELFGGERGTNNLVFSTVRGIKTEKMPLIMLVGCPSSGKSARSQELKEFFETQKGKTVHVISENDIIRNSGVPKNDVYGSAQIEKMTRADLKSNSLRKLTRSDVVIIDGGNYIKGYRYEIYCASKSTRSVNWLFLPATCADSPLDLPSPTPDKVVNIH